MFKFFTKPNARLFQIALALGVAAATTFVHAQVEVVVIGQYCSSSNNRDSGYTPCDAAYRIDLATGKRTLLSSYQGGFTEYGLHEDPVPKGEFGWGGIAISPSGGIFVAASGSGSLITKPTIITINPATGARQILSPLDDITYGPLLGAYNPFFEVAPTGQLVTVGDRFGALGDGIIISIDPVTGKRKILSDGTLNSQGVGFDDILGMDPTGRVLVIGHGTFQTASELLQVDAATGLRTLVNTIPNDSALYDSPLFFQGNEAVKNLEHSQIGTSNRYFNFSVNYPSINLNVTDMNTGLGKGSISDLNDPNKGPRIIFPKDLEWDSSGRLLLLDNGLDPTKGQLSLGGLYAIDPDSGVRTLISDFLDASQGPLIYFATSMAVGNLPASNTGGNNGSGNGTGSNSSEITPSQFSPGAKLTLNGQGFGAIKGKVMVGKKNATVLSWSDSSIVFVPPTLKACNYSIKLLTKKGKTINANAASVTVLAPTLATLSSSSAIKGDTLTITGSAFGIAKPKVFFLRGSKKKRVNVMKGFGDASVTVKVPKLKAGSYQVLISNLAGISTNTLPLQVQ